jgi:hypothetical protein
MYKFTQDVHSLATGKSYRKGQRVPPELIEPLLNSDVIEKIAEPEGQDYDGLKNDELRDLLKEKGLPIYGAKSELIERLKAVNK